MHVGILCEAGMATVYGDTKTGLNTTMGGQVTVGQCTQHRHNVPLNLLSLFQRIPHTESQMLAAPCPYHLTRYHNSLFL